MMASPPCLAAIESAGQYEIALMYGDPVRSADKLLLAKEALVGVAGRCASELGGRDRGSPGAAQGCLHRCLPPMGT